MHKDFRWNVLKEEAIIFFILYINILFITKFIILNKPTEVNTIIWKLYKKNSNDLENNTLFLY